MKKTPTATSNINGTRSVEHVAAALAAARSQVKHAKPMPLSASCIVHRDELLAALDQVAQRLPAELDQARGVVGEREELLARARAEASDIVKDGHRRAAALAAEHEVAAIAKAKADQLLATATQDADRMRREVDDYIDKTLARFEIALAEIETAVVRGRDRVRRRSSLEITGEASPDPAVAD